jgi:hypothetical protein
MEGWFEDWGENLAMEDWEIGPRRPPELGPVPLSEEENGPRFKNKKRKQPLLGDGGEGVVRSIESLEQPVSKRKRLSRQARERKKAEKVGDH